jgi:hypothetical protein
MHKRMQIGGSVTDESPVKCFDSRRPDSVHFERIGMFTAEISGRISQPRNHSEMPLLSRWTIWKHAQRLRQNENLRHEGFGGKCGRRLPGMHWILMTETPFTENLCAAGEHRRQTKLGLYLGQVSTEGFINALYHDEVEDNNYSEIFTPRTWNPRHDFFLLQISL